MAYSTSAVIGTRVNLEDGTSDRKAIVGTTVVLSDGGLAMYVSALSTISTFMAVGIDGDGNAYPLTTTNSATSKKIGFAQVSIASAAFGWVQLSGKPKVAVLASCSDNVPLYTTSTAGSLDDAVVSTGLVLGVTIPTRATSVSNATAVTCTAVVGCMIGTGDMD